MAAKPSQQIQRGSVAPPVAPPSVAAIKTILRLVLTLGNLTWTARFKRRCSLRAHGPGFNNVDVCTVLRRGKIVLGPQYDPSLESWRIELSDLIEGRKFVVQVALDCKSDYQTQPRLTIITANFARGRRAEVKEAKSYESNEPDPH